MGEDGMMTMDDPMSMELTESLAAGDTYSTTCSTVMPGFAGYAIARAGFRHAHGVAFVLGSFDGGATIDLAHGYLALVIPDPEFDNKEEERRVEKAWGSNPAFHAEFKGSHASGYPFFWV